MAVNSDLARLYGSEADAIYIAPLGTAMPVGLEELGSAFEDIGWLSEDGIVETPSASKEKIRGHQGAGVVRTYMSESGTEIAFTAYEDKELTNRLRYNVLSSETVDGVRTEERNAGQKVTAVACVIDLFDRSFSEIRGRFLIPRFEIGPDGERNFTNAEIAGFPFLGEIVGNYSYVSTDNEA